MRCNFFQNKQIMEILISRYGLPNFCYGVDGTHVALRNAPSGNELPPGLDPQDFWCRKQVKKILNVVLSSMKQSWYCSMKPNAIKDLELTFTT